MYKNIVQASLINKTNNKGFARTKNLEKSKFLAKNRIEATSAVKANAWREAKLAEYQSRKTRQL